MADSYLRILKLRPADQNAIENYPSALLYAGKTDAALKFYRQILKANPANDIIWLKYADTLTWVGDFTRSLKALESYRRLRGENVDYLKIKARVFALTGWYNSAFEINNSLLLKDKNNSYFLTTEILALNKGFQVQKAVDELETLNQRIPKNKQDAGLKKVLLTPLRSNINLEGVYTSASDTTRITNIPVTGQYFISPVTSILFLGLYENAKADNGSGLDTFNGRTSISDESAMIGFSHQFARWFNFSASGGGVKMRR